MPMRLFLIAGVILLSGCASFTEDLTMTTDNLVTTTGEMLSDVVDSMGETSSQLLTPVEPWQRGSLARPEMQFGYLSMDASFEDHTYFSKEATSGGRSFAGGGCGCN